MDGKQIDIILFNGVFQKPYRKKLILNLILIITFWFVFFRVIIEFILIFIKLVMNKTRDFVRNKDKTKEWFYLSSTYFTFNEMTDFSQIT
jgi:uncharacterized protein involved in cysteine biosynthesis